jgi:hypothetical protein
MGVIRPSSRSRSTSARLIPVIAIVNEYLCDRILENVVLSRGPPQIPLSGVMT